METGYPSRSYSRACPQRRTCRSPNRGRSILARIPSWVLPRVGGDSNRWAFGERTPERMFDVAPVSAPAAALAIGRAKSGPWRRKRSCAGNKVGAEFGASGDGHTADYSRRPLAHEYGADLMTIKKIRQPKKCKGHLFGNGSPMQLRLHGRAHLAMHRLVRTHPCPWMTPSGCRISLQRQLQSTSIRSRNQFASLVPTCCSCRYCPLLLALESHNRRSVSGFGSGWRMLAPGDGTMHDIAPSYRGEVLHERLIARTV